MNWDSIKFRASSWGNLMTEPVSKSDKEAGILSKTCQKELIKIYHLVKYGRKKEIVTKHMTKGILAEEDSITLFSRVEKKLYIKNQEYLANDEFCGHPDIFSGEDIRSADEVHDIKSSWELDTFMPKLIEEPDSTYDYQLQVYFDLTGATKGSIAYCLVNCPWSVLMDEKKRLLYSMEVVSDESPEYKKAEAELEKNLIFDDIDYRERVIKHEIYRDDEKIAKMKAKVPRLREYLKNLEEKHLNLYKNTLALQ